MNLYVGNLSPETTEGDLRTIFSEFGEVVAVKILLDAVTGLPRGFGFVEMADKYHGYDCITNLDMTYYQGNIINVRESKPKGQENTRGGGFNRGGSGGNRGGSGGGFNRNRTGSSSGSGRERTYNNSNGERPAYNRERTYNSDRPAYKRPDDRPNYNKDSGNNFNQDNSLYKNDDDLNFNKL